MTDIDVWDIDLTDIDVWDIDLIDVLSLLSGQQTAGGTGGEHRG